MFWEVHINGRQYSGVSEHEYVFMAFWKNISAKLCRTFLPPMRQRCISVLK